MIGILKLASLVTCRACGGVNALHDHNERWTCRWAKKLGTTSLREGEVLCPRCKCCGMTWTLCEQCDGEGYVDYEDEDPCEGTRRVPCDLCLGENGFWLCLCSASGVHRKAGTNLSLFGEGPLGDHAETVPEPVSGESSPAARELRDLAEREHGEAGA